MFMNCIALREYNLYRKTSPKSSSTLCSQRLQKPDTPATLDVCQIMSAFKAFTSEANQTPQTKNQNSDQPCTEKPEVPQMYPIKKLSTQI